MDDLVIGVDVGTGSARAGLFTLSGEMLASAVEPIEMWRPYPGYAEQSSDDIWNAVTRTVSAVMLKTNAQPEQVRGICYDATCSLVVLDRELQPLAVNEDGDNHRNIIVWMDHRALEETDEINAGRHEVLKYVGGAISPEMETPKLAWLKRHLKSTWEAAGKFLDLADFLTWRSSGVDTRSLCTLVCKWTYLGHENRWDRSYLESIGISEAFDGDRISNDVRPMGTCLGSLTPQAADELGLTTRCQVGVGIIDAHAGGLGLLGSIWTDGEARSPGELETALALIGGTSSCLMAVSEKPRYVEGIWGPYYGAMVPDMWLAEGGQSAAGSAIDHIIRDHVFYPKALELAKERSLSIYELLNDELARLQKDLHLPYMALLTRNLHMTADFLGNRSPYADPHAAAVIDGLTLDESLVSLALRYYSVIQAVAYSTRDVARSLNDGGFQIDTLLVTGGGTKNPIWLQEHADATGLSLILGKEEEAVLLGSAVLAAAASGAYPDVPTAMQKMSGRGRYIKPNPITSEYHSAKFKIFRDLYTQHVSHRNQMLEF